MVHYQERNKQVTASRENCTGIPAQLKKRVEDNTALGLDDVRVHYNSGKPAELDALAFTQGNQVYLGPGQERHLPHELGHVVQQKLGMVRPDTRHESGAMLNTDPALERQADRIGAGGGYYASSPVRDSGGQVAQRMSVLEDRRDGVNLQIVRYKRSGWQAVQKLGRFLTEDCMKEISVGQLEALSQAIQSVKPEELYEKMESVTGGIEIVQYRPEFQQVFAEKLAAAKAAAGPLEAWNAAAGELRDVLEQCSAVVGGMSEGQRAPMKMAELEKKGQYQRTEPLVNPYFNYKKAALYCIAQKASIKEKEEGKPVGPHIALSVIGKKIYAANNSSFANREKQQPITQEELAGRLKDAMLDIEEREIRGILCNGLISKAEFELGAGRSIAWDVRQIHQYIQQLKGYDILIVDAPGYRKMGPIKLGPIHGEMAIMDYLQNNENGRSFIAHRGEKLRDVEGDQDRDLKRVIWIGGTRVDCAKCHEHFREINASNGEVNSLGRGLERAYVVSSREVGNGGTPYGGTEGGTHLSAKKIRADKLSDEPTRTSLRQARTEIVASLPAGAAPV